MARRDNTKKFGVWEFSLDDRTIKQEIRITTSGKIQLSTTLSDGTVMNGDDADKFRLDVHARVRALNALTWEKVIVVACKGKATKWFANDDKNRAELNVTWAIRYKAQGPRHDMWKETLDAKRSNHHHGIGSSSDGEKVRVLPWTQHTEDFLTAIIAGMDAMGQRIEDFFLADELEHRIASASTQLLLGPKA